MVRLERLDDLVLVDARLLGELGDRRRAAEVGGRGLDRPRELQAQLLHPPRDVEGPGAVAEVALDLADDRRHRVRRELHAALDVEALDREHEPDRADLDEVLERLAAPGVAGGEASGRAACTARRARRARDRRRRGTRRAARGRRARSPLPSSPLGRGRRRRQLDPVATGSVLLATRRRRGASARARRARSSSCELANGPSARRKPVGAANASSVTVSPSSSCTSRLSSASSRSSTRSTGSSNRETGRRARAGRRCDSRGRGELDDDAVDAVGRAGALKTSLAARAPRPPSAASRLSCSANTRSSSVISKIRRMCGSVQTTLTRPPTGRSCLSAPEQHAERHRVDERRLAEVDHERGCATVDRLVDRRPELGSGVEVGLAEHGDDGDPSPSPITSDAKSCFVTSSRGPRPPSPPVMRRQFYPSRQTGKPRSVVLASPVSRASARRRAASSALVIFERP